jgi:hypothetical protein
MEAEKVASENLNRALLSETDEVSVPGRLWLFGKLALTAERTASG